MYVHYIVFCSVLFYHLLLYFVVLCCPHDRRNNSCFILKSFPVDNQMLDCYIAQPN